MSTRAEDFKAQEQRERSIEHSREEQQQHMQSGGKKTSSRHEQRPEDVLDGQNGHVEKKAIYVREDNSNSEEGARPSRKSTRKASNRMKTDAPLEHAHQMNAMTPEARYERTANARTPRR